MSESNETTAGLDGLRRPGPAVDVEGCPYNECQIRLQCTRPPCGRAVVPPPPSGVAAISGAVPELPEDDHSSCAACADAEIESLNREQREGEFHPMTCGSDRGNEAHRRYAEEHGDRDEGLLVATHDGWRCPVPGCGYQQPFGEPPHPLETEVANLRGAVDMLQQAAAGHVAEIERLTKERDATLGENGDLRATLLASAINASTLEYEIGIDLTDTTEHLADRLLRVRLVVLGQQRAASAKAETLARWKRRAKKAEADVAEVHAARSALLRTQAQRIAALEQERDGLTLRLGKRVKGQVKRKAARAKGRR